MTDEQHFPTKTLEAGLETIRASPKLASRIDLIVRRPASGIREFPDEARLDEASGLIGDNWQQSGSSQTADGRAHPDMQLTVMNSRAIALIAGSDERWPLAGDQLFIDLDLSIANLPAGSRLRVGEAVIEITAPPHTGCAKFKMRFGAAALAFVNSPHGRELRLRGANARIVSGGVIRVGGDVVKIV
jgi:hypothetical protein